MSERQLGIAGITHQPHKFIGFLKSEELTGVPHKWLQVGNLHEPHGVGNRPLGDGKMQVQEMDLASRGAFDILSHQHLWLLASMDVNMWNAKQINKPNGDPYQAVADIARGMLATNNRRIGISNILTTKVYGEENRRVGWRDAFIMFTPGILEWMSDVDAMIRTIERGDVRDDLVTNQSSGGLRWDQFVVETLNIGKRNQEKLSVYVGGVTVAVYDRDTALAASTIVNPFLRSVAPGLKEAAYASALRRM